MVRLNSLLRATNQTQLVRLETGIGGVAVYFTLKGQQFCFACDHWDEIKDNMQAIHKTIEALRGIERCHFEPQP